MAFDLALAAEIQLVVTPPPVSPVVIEEPWRSNAALRAEETSELKIRRARLEFAQWQGRIAALQDRLIRLVDSGWDDDLTPMLDEQIVHAEERAEERAKRVASASKDIERIQRALKRRDATLAAVHRKASRDVLELQRETIEGLLDFALFLRSVRSSVSSGSKTGPPFEASDDLDAYLRSVLSA